MKRFFIFLIFPISLFVSVTKSHGEVPSPNITLFYEQVQKEVGRALRKRDGLVIWIDRQAHHSHFFGNESLKSQKFPPGSLMKLITAEAGLKMGEAQDYQCVGHDEIAGRKYACWTYRGHGLVDLPKALARSCNLYFARWGMTIGWEPLLSTLYRYGFSIPQSLSSSPVLDPVEGRGRAGVRGTVDEDLPTFAIGDSARFLVTPVEIAHFWDHYLDLLQDPRASGIKQGLLRAVQEGTASRAGVKGLEILGKTGTSDSLHQGYKTDGWFLGATPAQTPRFALVIYLKDAHGYDEPAALGKRIFLLAKKLGVVEEGR